MSSPRVSVVVATRDRPEGIRRLLASLDEQRLDPPAYEVIVVDDASTDPELHGLDGRGSSGTLRVLRHERPRGPAAARNTGWRVARGNLIAFIDDDCRADHDWLEALLESWDGGQHEVLQGRTRPDPDWVGPLPPFGYTLDVGGPDGLYETCNIAYPRELLERLGGFDEAFTRPCGEDVDLGIRARAHGARLNFVADAVVFHDIRSPGARGSVRRAWMRRDVVRVVRNHAELRNRLFGRIFFKRSHALLTLALVGCAAAAARRRPLVAVAAGPYLASVVSGHRGPRKASRAALRLAPSQFVIDLVEFVAMLVGSIKHRAPML